MSTIDIELEIHTNRSTYWKKIKKEYHDELLKCSFKKVNEVSMIENTEGCVIKHSKSVIYSVCSQKQQYLATTSGDKAVRIFSNNGELIREYLNQYDSDKTLAFSFDGMLLASGGSYDKVIRIWNMQNPEIVTELRGLTNKIGKLHFYHRRNDRLISVTQNSEIQVWDVNKGVIVAKMIGPQSNITSIQISDDDFRCVTAQYDGSIIEWDLQSFSQLKTWQAHQKGCFALKYVNGRHCLISGGGDKKIKIWNMEKYRLCKQLIGHTDTVNALDSFGTIIISCTFSQTIQWDIRNWNMIKIIPITQLDYCYVSMNENNFVTGWNGNSVKVWDLM